MSPVKDGSETSTLESDVPLSRSLIWRRQLEFYARRGLQVWSEDNLPTFITSNPFIAEVYARIVCGYLRDCMGLEKAQPQAVSPERPLRILELGAGTGKFAYLFLRQLVEMLQATGLSPEPVRYCMTDCSEGLVEYWRRKTQLAEFVERGLLEFNVLSVGENITSSFGRAQAGVESEAPRGPLVVIANYVFDSLPQDAFIVQNGQIFEAVVTTTTACAEEPSGMSSLRLTYNNVEMAQDRYDDPTSNQILEGYRARLPAATVLFPSEALRILKELAKPTNGRMLVLAADKGFVHEEDLQFLQGPPELEWHASLNCFSQTVNFDALAKHFQYCGGRALLPEKRSANLSICGFQHCRAGDEFPSTNAAYRDSQENFGVDDLFSLLAWLNAHMEEISAQQVLAVLRLSRWDPIALLRLFPILARQLHTVKRERYDLRDAVLRTWANHYPVQPGENALAFQCGVILLELRFFEEAQSMFRASERELGRSAATSYNLALCSQGLGHDSESLAFLVEACKLDPAFEPARMMRGKLEEHKEQR